MKEMCSVALNARLPRDVAEMAEEIQKTDPEFFSRVVLYGITRRSIYRHLRKKVKTDDSEGGPGGNLDGARPEKLFSSVLAS